MANCFSLQQKVESEEVALVVKTCNPAIDASAGVGGQSGFWVYAPFVMGDFVSWSWGWQSAGCYPSRYRSFSVFHVEGRVAISWRDFQVCLGPRNWYGVFGGASAQSLNPPWLQVQSRWAFAHASRFKEWPSHWEMIWLVEWFWSSPRWLRFLFVPRGLMCCRSDAGVSTACAGAHVVFKHQGGTSFGPSFSYVILEA